jgi:two-component system cell cycle sensor histidine kinase/response regulator CckA
MIGSRLRQLRSLRGLTLDQVAERSGVNRGTIHRIESDQVSPRVDTLQLIGRALDLDLQTFFGTDLPPDLAASDPLVPPRGIHVDPTTLASALTARFGNLLMAIQGCLERVDPHLPEPQALRELQGHLDRAAWMLNQARDAFGNTPLLHRGVDLGTLIRNLEATLNLALRPGQRLHLEVDPALPRIAADPSLVVRLIRNLVHHGTEALGTRGGPIHLRVEGLAPPRGGIQITLRHAAPDPTQREAVPLDFALPAIQRITEDHGGSLTLQTEGSEAGIGIHLPAGPSQAEARESRAPLLGGTVLLVEDEEAVRAATTRLLEHLGFRVLAAEGGPEALDLHAQHHHEIDLVLLDLHMPGLSGREVLAALRARDPRVRVALCTGSAVPDLGPEANLVGVLQKPYRAAALQALLDECLEG